MQVTAAVLSTVTVVHQFDFAFVQNRTPHKLQPEGMIDSGRDNIDMTCVLSMQC
jgi:hypothetical protein